VDLTRVLVIWTEAGRFNIKHYPGLTADFKFAVSSPEGGPVATKVRDSATVISSEGVGARLGSGEGDFVGLEFGKEVGSGTGKRVGRGVGCVG
jgi:hypothetical protein